MEKNPLLGTAQLSSPKLTHLSQFQNLCHHYNPPKKTAPAALKLIQSDCETSLHSINGVEIHTWKKENHLTVRHCHRGHAFFHDCSEGVKNFYACFCH
jgi:hypothetical protein